MPLNYRKRPKCVQDEIDQSYAKISQSDPTGWGLYNGRKLYNIALINDHRLIERVILSALQGGQDHIILMDVGAGDFSWGKEAARFINSHPLFNKIVHVDLVSVRGERNTAEEKIEDGVCTRYEYGHFKVENLQEELEKRGHEINDQVDLLVSAACFRHLVDATGTMLQAYQLLSPSTGIMCVEGFHIPTSIPAMSYPRANLVPLFASYCAPFFWLPFSYEKFGHFFMQKTDAVADIPLSYENNLISSGDYTTSADKIAEFSVDEAKKEGWNKPNEMSSPLDPRTTISRSIINKEGEQFLQAVLDDSDVIDAKFTKLNELFDTKEASNFAAIHWLLQNLMELDIEKSAKVIEKLLSEDEQFTIQALNYLPPGEKPLLIVAMSKAIHNETNHVSWDLFKRLHGIVSPELLNARYNGPTIAMIAVRLVSWSDDKRALDFLLSDPSKLDLTIDSGNVKAVVEAVEDASKALEEFKRQMNSVSAENTEPCIIESLTAKKQKAQEKYDYLVDVHQRLFDMTSKNQNDAQQDRGVIFRQH